VAINNLFFNEIPWDPPTQRSGRATRWAMSMPRSMQVDPQKDIAALKESLALG